MSTAEIEQELRRVKKRLAELEAANGMRGLAPDSDDAATLAEVCRVVGIGVRTVTSASRERETVTKRHVVARVLRKRMGWTVPRISAVLAKTERAIEKMV